MQEAVINRLQLHQERGQQATEAALGAAQQTDFQMLWNRTCNVTDAENTYVIVAGLLFPFVYT